MIAQSGDCALFVQSLSCEQNLPTPCSLPALPGNPHTEFSASALGGDFPHAPSANTNTKVSKVRTRISLRQ
jgi:hypothetical protein